MFLEPKLKNTTHKKGWIEVVCGSMFSGKTEELIRRVNRSRIANLKVEIYKPAIDTRYHDTEVVSHNSNAIESIAVDSSLTILLMHQNADVVGIDEAQFFDDEIIYVCETLAQKGVRVIVAGLDMDYLGKPFGPMPSLMAIAEYVTKVNAICVVCGDLATHSFRKSKSDNQVLLGEKDVYEARCRHCFTEGMSNKTKG
ncbi:MAG: thymidine kinase [Bacteroidia bacterium]|nr:thymidine kinase [Bacteroidia bacterium]